MQISPILRDGAKMSNHWIQLRIIANKGSGELRFMQGTALSKQDTDSRWMEYHTAFWHQIYQHLAQMNMPKCSVVFY